jgi:hypothetical protein
MFSLSQAVTAIGDTASTNIYDNGAVNPGDLALTSAFFVNVLCTTACTSAGAAPVTPVLQDSADGSTWNDALVGPAFALASLTAGAVVMQAQPPAGLRRYLRVIYRVGTATLTAGAFNAWISLTVQRNVSQASGFKVV